MLGDMALHEQRAHVGVEAGGDQRHRHLEGVGPQLGGVLGHGQRVQVDDRVVRIGEVLVTDPISDRTEQVAQMHVA